MKGGRKGKVFEEIFSELCKRFGYICGKDFTKIGSGRYIPGGMPDFYFPKSKTYVELKYTSTGSYRLTSLQRKKFVELIKKGYSVKIFLIRTSIEDFTPFTNTSLETFFENLRGDVK